MARQCCKCENMLPGGRKDRYCVDCRRVYNREHRGVKHTCKRCGILFAVKKPVPENCPDCTKIISKQVAVPIAPQRREVRSYGGSTRPAYLEDVRINWQSQEEFSRNCVRANEQGYQPGMGPGRVK